MRHTPVLVKAGQRYTLTPGPHVERRGRRWQSRWHLRAVDRITPVLEVLLGRLACMVDATASDTAYAWTYTINPSNHADS